MVKKPYFFCNTCFLLSFFLLPYRFTGDCDYSNKYNRFSIVNNILRNITTQLKYYQRWLRDGSRWQREQAQASNIISRGRRQLRGSWVPRAGLGEENFFLLKLYRFGYRSVIVLGHVLPTFKLSNCWLSKTYLCKWKYIYIWICRLYLHAHFDIYIYEGCSKFFHLENVIFAKKILSPNFRELHVYLSRYMLAKIFKKKRGCVISSNCSRRLIPRHTSICGSCT